MATRRIDEVSGSDGADRLDSLLSTLSQVYLPIVCGGMDARLLYTLFCTIRQYIYQLWYTFLVIN